MAIDHAHKLKKKTGLITQKKTLKLPGKSLKRKIRRGRDDLNVWQKRLQTCARKKVKTPSEAKIFLAVHTTALRTCQKQLKEQCHTALSFFGLYNYVATNVAVFNEHTSKLESFSLLEDGELPFIDDSE